MAMPAITPAESLGEVEALPDAGNESEPEVGGFENHGELGDAVVSTPRGLTLLYALQFGEGAATGQSLARQMELRLLSVGGKQRELYLAFMAVNRELASESENP